MNFLNSNLALKLKECSMIEKEKAFCIKLIANEVFEDAKDETILVQGIIDVFGIDENREIILVDYKTDYVQDENELKVK